MLLKKKDGQITTFDFADYRDKTFKGDLNRRDFTINALSLDLTALKISNEIYDVLKDYKGSIDDIKAKRIKMVSTKAFVEDPLRMLRAFSLKAKLNFKIEQKTLYQIKKNVELIRNVSYERIRDELFKILETQKAAETLKIMHRIGLLENIIPQIRVMYNCKQGAYHHLDVWPHSLETVIQLEKLFQELQNDPELKMYLRKTVASDRGRSSLIKLAALLHDIGKPETRKKEKGRFSFHGHERVGKNITRTITKMLKLSKIERYALEDMVLWHLRPGFLSNFKKPTDRAIYRFFRDAKEETASILILSLADQRATRGPLTTQRDQKHHEKICLGLIKKYFEKQKEKPFVRIISGNDLKKRLKLKPSPLFGKILLEIEEKQILGKIKTKKDALELAKKIAKKKNV